MTGPLSPPMLLSVRQQTSEMLRVAIYDGELAPGERLTERQICEMYGVSRTIAREVIRELEAERLIESNRRHGFVVAQMSSQEIYDLYEVRILLESRACELCASNMNAQRATTLDASMAAIEAAAKSGDRNAQRASNGRFYDEIFDAAGNVVLGQILNSLHSRVSYLRSTSMSQSGRPAESLRELKALLAALKAGDGTEAAKLSTAHIVAARRVALQAIGGQS